MVLVDVAVVSLLNIFEKFINYLWWVFFCENSLQLKACFCCNIVFFQDISAWCQEAAILKNFPKTFLANKAIFEVSDRNLSLKTLAQS